MLFYLIYFSKSVTVMQEEDVLLLLKQSREWNEAHGLTGMLVYIEGNFKTHKEGRFMQVLEGSQFEVERIFDKIAQDKRHHQVTLLKVGLIENRYFNTWQMGFESLNLEEHPDLYGFFQFNEDVLRSEEFAASDAVLNFLKSFYDHHDHPDHVN